MAVEMPSKVPANQPRVRFGGVQTPRGYLFELTGGRLCLDLANTLDERATDHPRELLRGYKDLVDWAVQARALSSAEGQRLRRHAAAHPSLAARALGRTTATREVLFAIFSAAARRKAVPAGLLDALSELSAQAFARRRLENAPGGSFEWKWEFSERPDLDSPLWAAVASAVDLLTSPGVDRVRQCEGDGCAWLFIDTSKNGSRRWCDMSVCGNRAKARRHRGRPRNPPPPTRRHRALLGPQRD